MIATFSGDYNDHPTQRGYTATLRYSVSAPTITTENGITFYKYSWNEISGTPSPVTVFQGEITGSDGRFFTFTEFTAFSIQHYEYGYQFSLAGPGFSVDNIGLQSFGSSLNSPGANLSLDIPYAGIHPTPAQMSESVGGDAVIHQMTIIVNDV